MFCRPISAVILLPVFFTVSAHAAEQDALAISSEIQQRHMPYGMILDPIFASSASNQISNYTRCGDSALWTGHYLAAEAFRYKFTNDPAALANAWRALEGLRTLVYVTGTSVLARCAFPVDSPYAASLMSQEQAHGVHTGMVDQTSYYWIGDTSRDEYSGVFFGLEVARELIDDPAMPPTIQDLVWRMLVTLENNDWNVVMPDGTVSTTFTIRPDQQLTLLQIGRNALPDRFGSDYSDFALTHFALVPAPIGVDVLDPYSSYFKFNLDTINMYSLVRLENNPTRQAVYQQSYQILRNTTDGHQNAHFNMIDRAIDGPNASRDSDTVQFLEAWLTRPRLDFYVDLTSQVPVCGGHACNPIPVAIRPPADFLWQVSPFQLSGGGSGVIEGAGIDYILPYWMARYYGVIIELEHRKDPDTLPMKRRNFPRP